MCYRQKTLLMLLLLLSSVIKSNAADLIFSRSLIELIENQEGFVNHPYKDLSGMMDIGYGHVIKPSEQHYLKKITKTEAEELLISDLISIKLQVDSLIKVKLNKAKLETLYALVYNIGIGNFAKSNLLKDINSDMPTARLERDFKSFTYYSRKIYSKHLKQRRDLEWMLWKEPSKPTLLDFFKGKS